ncbi:asparagine synthase-related protein [Massilia sp. R2A-15]|uniref:asparagine synthase-related protein n=1 Tax=Massilia sp. R2A-15 TaxID=3064278 RepID=UPI0027341DCB|nr:asparagine synthase-related protein [Massilia sp. R2A-15]WLI91300.1 asparagine synthase-related protein [Massilia sp. R2A-15]
MSGLCGWFSSEPGALPIGEMAAPLCRNGAHEVVTAEHRAGALAVATAANSATLLREDGLIVAMWGDRADTLARLWRSHGAKACAALSGSFAFAIIDERRGEALLAVDRTGARPLYYQQLGRTLAFASSADALARHPGAGHEIDPQALYSYLYFHGVPAPASIYKGQRRLMPGESLHMCGARMVRTRYWKPQFDESAGAGGPALQQELVDTVRGASADAQGAGAAGVLLSGGRASAAIATLLGSANPVRTYAIGYGDEAALAPARRLAQQLGARHRELVASAGQVADAAVRLAAGCDQPHGDPALLSTYFGAGLARADGVQRLLAGHGGASLFGMRAHYARQARLSQYERIPSALRQTLVEPFLFRLAGRVRAAPLRHARSYIEDALASLPQRLEASNLLHGYGSAEVLEPGFMDAIDPTAPAAMLGESWWQSDGCSQVNQLIALDLQFALAGCQLPAAIGACRLAGIEAAFPFLGDAVIAFAARLAPQHKLDGARLAPLWRKALNDLLPPRQGPRARPAAPPLAQWLHAEPRIRQLVSDSLSDLKRRHIVRAGFIDTLLAAGAGVQPQPHARMAWLLMMLEQWLAQRPGAAVRMPAARGLLREPESCRP